MKLLAFLIFSVWLAGSELAEKKGKEIGFANDKRRALYDYVNPDDPCGGWYNQPFDIYKLPAISQFNWMRTIPLTNWDCAYYRMINIRGVPDNQINEAIPYTDIFTWMDKYNGETNSDIDVISVNSVIACAFWIATGAPTFFALIMLCVGLDVGEHESHKSYGSSQKQNVNIQLHPVSVQQTSYQQSVAFTHPQSPEQRNF